MRQKLVYQSRPRKTSKLHCQVGNLAQTIRYLLLFSLAQKCNAKGYGPSPITYHHHCNHHQQCKRTWLIGSSGRHACRHRCHNRHKCKRDGHILPRHRIGRNILSLQNNPKKYKQLSNSTSHTSQANQHKKILTAYPFRQNP